MRRIGTSFAVDVLSPVAFGSVLGTLLRGIRTAGTLHTRSYFYVGQTYNTTAPSAVAHGQMYVEHLTPANVTQPYPLVFIHGREMTGTNILATIDGEQSWADYFLAQGYELYLVDQPARARSAYQAGLDGPQSTMTTFDVESRFTAVELFNLWPQAALHTQWPGNGSVGDPIFDNFYAATVPSLVSEEESSMKIRAAGSVLLDQIGPVILLTHSQSGQFGWLLGDARPNLVKAIVALEPIGPPFINAVLPPIVAARPFGVTEIPMVYSPPINSADELQREVVSVDANASPARQLANLVNIPVLMVSSEASYHTVYDNCTAGYLQQAGVSVTYVKLPEVGIHGNGHMMFLEMNRIDIVENVVQQWLTNISSLL
ncbi:alpha/beta-hydrolase [Mucidula mucida]|nr:alpha/beta-hydrolase [Mucidula mucida]